MSTYSAAWHDTPPAIRDFYRNFALRYTQARYPDFAFGPNWAPRSGSPYNAYRNWTHQTAASGSFNPATVNFISDSVWGYLLDTLPWDTFESNMYTDQFQHVPDFAFDYPRDKGNVRRSYWTGKPVRRRNL